MRNVEATTERRKPRFRSVNADLAGEINQELAHLINAACRELDPDDRDQLRLYWQVHDELFDILDMAFLLMTDEGVTVAQGKSITAAMRIHIRNCMARWRERLDEFRAKQQHLRDKLAEIDADVRALMGDEDYPHEPEPEPELEPPPRAKPAQASQERAWTTKRGAVVAQNSFFKRYR